MTVLSRSKPERTQPCPKCGNPPPHKWVPVGHYLDKDLVCERCGHVIDIWDC